MRSDVRMPARSSRSSSSPTIVAERPSSRARFPHVTCDSRSGVEAPEDLAAHGRPAEEATSAFMLTFVRPAANASPMGRYVAEGTMAIYDRVTDDERQGGGDMKRLQIYIEEELDDALAVRAHRTHTSKAALIREAVRQSIGEPKPLVDPFRDWIGGSDAASARRIAHLSLELSRQRACLIPPPTTRGHRVALWRRQAPANRDARPDRTVRSSNAVAWVSAHSYPRSTHESRGAQRGDRRYAMVVM
jgi:ribbon-helix-helix CopG family protein